MKARIAFLTPKLVSTPALLKSLSSPTWVLVWLFLVCRSVCSEPGPGSIVQFEHDACEIEFHSKFAFNSYHNASPFWNEGVFELLVRFRGSADGHIALTVNDDDSEPLYMIIIGSYNNRVSEIRRTKRAVAQVKINTPGVLSPDKWRGFVVRYSPVTGNLLVYPEGSDNVYLHWKDPQPLQIRYFSFTTYNGRILQVAFDCRAKDEYSSVPKRAGGLNADFRTTLLHNYDTKTPPPKAEDGTGVTVGLGMTLSFFTVEEIEHIFVVNAWIRMTWKDSRLMFPSSATNGSYMHFGNGEIWQPDLTLYNNAFPTEIDHYGDTHLLAQPDGTILWLPPARLAAHCTLNMIRWPYDTHTCELKIGSWTHHGEEVDLQHIGGRDSNDSEKMIDNFNFVKNSEWHLLSSKATRNEIIYDCCPEPYIDLTFSFTFQRDSPSYVVSFVLPIIFISIVNMLAFLLPPSSGEKILLGAVNFFILCIFLLFFSAKLPPLGDHLPLLVLLYGCNLVLVSISLCITVIVLNLTRTRRVSSPPQCFRILCNVHFASVLGLGHITPFVSKTHSRFDDGVEMESPIGSSRRRLDLNGDVKDSDRTSLVVDGGGGRNESPLANAEWILLACMIDRVAFISYAIVNGIILGICLS